MKDIRAAGFGGGCHWCTEAVFSSIRGVSEVRQGFLSTREEPERFSEGVWLTFDAVEVSFGELVEIHLLTHASQSVHSLRHKYRSAIYWRDEETRQAMASALHAAPAGQSGTLITQLVELGDFRDSPEQFREYYARRPEAPFCTTYIEPKLKLLRERYPDLFRKAGRPADGGAGD